VEEAHVRPNPAYERQRVDEWSRHVRAWVLRSYEFVFLPILAAGAVAFLWSSVVYRRTVVDNVCYVLACAAWLIVALRVLFLALVDATSMPALNEAGYAAPAHYLVVAAAVFSMAGWYQLRARPAPVTS
jgi:hypothetical protein